MPRTSRPPAGEPSAAEEREQPRPGLWVVATPIGHLGDLSPRARWVLAAADLVVCEDTRVTGRLLRHFGITARLRSYHEHNAPRVRPAILAELERGAVVVLVSDAGTPTIADPGYRLVREAHARGIPVRAVPGPSAVVAALSIAGLPTDRFFFQGFLPPRRARRRAVLAELARIPATLVIYEAPHRIAETLRDAAEVLGDREAALVREITKLHEECRRGRLGELAARIEAEGPPRGELVLVIAPPAEAAGEVDEAGLDAALREALARSSLRDAVAEVARRFDRSRREVYRRALALVGGRDRSS